MWNEEDRKWLYEQMKNAGVNTGSYDEFKTSLSNKEDRDWYYQKSRSMGLNVGSANDFASMMVEPQKPVSQPQQKPVSQPKANVKPAGQQPVNNPSTSRQQNVRTVQPTVNVPTVQQMIEQNRWKPQPMFETETYLTEDGKKAQRPRVMPGTDDKGQIATEGVYRDVLTGEEYDAKDPNTKKMVNDATQRMAAPQPIDLESANRKQVNELSRQIDSALEQAKGQSVRQYYDRTQQAADKGIWASIQEAMQMTAGAADPTDMQRQVKNYVTRSEGVPTQEAEALNKRIKDLEGAQRTMRNAQRIIAEADHNAQSGSFGKWLESSFAGGAARGFGQKLFDVDTWDMGASDGQDAVSLLSALRTFDKGEQLTESQKILLDAKAVELATNAYFGSYVGRGYKAGEVTAESLPFMLEMCINPAAGTGNAAQNILTRYALKRFGKSVVKNNAKKYVAARTAARVAGDIAGSAAMSATTGMTGVAGDAISRQTGNVLNETDEQGNSIFIGHTEGDDFGTAFSKAFGARTIENYSEMVGEYFAPVLKLAGGGLAKVATSKVGTKLGLDHVKNFVDNVASSDIAQLVGDFEKNAKWNGVFGEYAEEVAGGIMNALVVGDQTLDTNPETGVFNLDNNIDTFLGVSLMGGVLSGIKTLGYRTPKYRARKEMERDDNKAATAFGNQDTWGEVRNALAFGTDEDAKNKLAEVLSNPDFTEEQKRAAMQYAKSVQTYRGMLQTENKKRTDEDADPLQNDAETSFDNGYSLESDQELQDAKNMYDFQRQRVTDLVSEDFLAGIDRDPMGTLNSIVTNENWTAEERQTILDYVNAKATFDGMITRVQDDIESKILASDAMIDGRVNPSDGMIHPATMKIDDRKVYVVNGNINMNEDGTGIDLSNSDESILIRDAETGNMEFADPRSVLSIDEAMDAAKVKQEAQDAIRLSVAQEAANRIDGTLAFNADDAYNVVDENGQEHVVTVLPQPVADTAGTGADNADAAAVNPDVVTVSVDGGEAVAMNKADVQQMADNASMKRLTDYETEKKAKEEAKAAAEREAQRPVYQQNDEITIQTERGPVRGSITLDDVNGEGYEVSTEVPVDGKVIHRMTREQLDAAIVEHNGKPVSLAQNDVQSAGVVENGAAEVEAVQADAGVAQGNAQAGAAVNADAATEQVAQTEEAAAVEPMPMIGEGEDAEPDFSKVDATRAHTYLYNEAGLSREEANQFVEANKKAADKKLETLKGKKPQMGTSIAKYRKESAAWQQKVDEAKKNADYWDAVRSNQAKIVAAENAERAKRDEDVRQQAVAAEQQRQQEVLQKREEQAQLGSNNVAPQIKEKWQNANKLEGVRNEIVLPNGERVAGKYVLVESGAATPSHNPNAEFVKNEGFPVDENGQSVNDRDYERDNDAKALTRNIASQYDSRALQTPVVVSNDGVVLSGNGRTMAGELAAQNGTDGAYIDYLKQYGSQFGFDAQTVAGMQHPRVLFVPDEAMPYTAETFAKFNQQDMKGQSKTEQAVKLGKIVGNDAFSGIVGSINKYNTLAEFYADTAAATEAINALQKAGAISQAQYSEMFDGDTISAQGRELLENVLIGKAFESNPDAVRQITAFKSVRQSVIAALAEIANNIKLGKDYSCESEIAQAIALVYHARNNGYKAGDRVSSFARQLNLFPFDEGETVADYNNATVMQIADALNDSKTTLLKKWLQVYNSRAKDSAMGQMDMFTGKVAEKEEIINEVKQLFSNGTKEEQQKATEDAIEKRKADSIQKDDAGTGSNEGVQQAESEVATEETQDNPAIPFGAAVNNADNVNNETPALSLKMKQEIMRQYLSDVDGDMRLLYNMTEEDIDEFLAVLDKWEEVNDKLGEVQQQYGELAKSKNKDVAENAQNIIKQAEQASVEAYMPVQDLYHDMLEKYGIEDDMELANAPVQGTDEAIAQAEAVTEQNPTEGQKEAGNYKKGHVKIDGFDISIENPKGSERKGTDAQGKPWSVTMNNTYGYIRRTEGVDGDHIDVFLSDNLADWNGTVFVVDQVNTDGTFDEHKVMYGFNTAEEAKAAYMANYSEGWQGFGNITGVSKEEFKKWIDSSHRKTKPFAEYKNVKSVDEATGGQKKGAFGTIYTQFKGKAKEAIAWLMQKKEGEASGALHHHSIGDISLVWGDNKTGLAKIAKKHPEVLDDLQNIIDSMEVVKESDNRVKLESNTHFAVVSKEYKGEPREKWLLTAYEKKETSEPANSRMDVESNLNGKSDDTATRQNPDVSDGKGTQNSDNKQEKAEKSAKKNGYSITSVPYTTKRGKKLDTLLVKFDELSKEQKRLASDLAKKLKGWWSFDNGGFMMRDAESAQQLVDAVMDETQETLKDNERMSLSDMQVASGVDEQEKKEAPISRTDTPTADMFIGRIYHSKKDPSRITLVTEQIKKGIDAGMLSMLVLKNGEIVERQKYPVNIFANIINKGLLYPVTDELDEKTSKWVEEWKADKEANKDVKLELADEADGSRDAKPRGTVAESEKTKKDDAKKEERDPRYREGWDGDYDEWKKRRDYYDEIERKEKKAVEEGREAYYVAGVDSWGQRDGTFHKLWLLPSDVKKDQWGNLVYNGTELWTEESAWHSEEGFQLGKIYYTGDEFTKAKNVAKSKKFIEEPTVENHDWSQYNEGDLFEYEGNKCKYQFYDNGIMSGVPGVVVEWLDENGNALGKESVPPLMFIEKYKKVESPAAKQQGTVSEETGKAEADKAGTGEAQNIGEAYGASNALVSRDRYEELKKRMRMKLGGQMNMGIDPEILAIGTEMAAFHIEAGARKFSDYAKKMIEDLGDAIRPYLKSFYNGARELPEVEAAGYSVDMTPYEDVRAFDVANFDKAVPDAMATADEVVKEQEAAKQAEEAINKLTEERNDVRKAMEESEEPVGRPATEADFENDNPIVYYKGKRTRAVCITHKGMQAGAAVFEKPHIEAIFLATGDYVKLSDLTIIDKQEGMTEKEAVQEILKIADKGRKERKSKKKSVSLQPQLDLFGEEEENVKPLNNNDNGLQGNDGTRTEGLPANGNNRREKTGGMGKSTGQEGKRADRGGEASGSRGLRSDVLDSVRLDEQLTQEQQTAAGQERPAADTAGTGAAKKEKAGQAQTAEEKRPANPKNTNNNRAERGKDYAPKSVDARIQANIRAIELMKQLVENGEKATAEQMAVLRQYSGWGGLGKAFERGKIDYKGKSTDLVLQELLGPEGYNRANMSRNSAYFTPAPIIDTLWDIAKAMGFKGGNVLEGSAGIGNIIGLMPTEISERSNIHAVEIDSTTGNILSLLYPDAQVDIQGFEKTDIENGSIDLAITNVPFVPGLRVNDTTGDKDLSKKFHDIHDFCIAKNVRKLREGGIGIFITTRGTMDNSTRLREWIVNEGCSDFVGAFRLHKETFGGASATSDILVIRKRVNGRVSPHAINVSGIAGERVADYDTGETKKVKGEVTPIIKKLSMDYNQYFVEHPEQMAGEMKFGFEKNDTYRPTSKGLYPSPNKPQNEMLSKWAQSFAGKKWDSVEKRTDNAGTETLVYEHLGKDVKEGSLLIDSKGNLCTAKKGVAIPLMAAQADKGKAKRTDKERIDMFQNKKIKGHTKAECFKAYSDIKNALAEVLDYQSNNDDDAGLQPLLDKLNKAYDKFVATYGHFHKNNQLSFLKNDVDFSSVFALEKFKETADASGKKVQQFGKTDVFSRRVVQQEKNPEPKNVKDGIIASIYIHGRIDVPYISEQLGKSEQEVRDEILKTGLGYENPTSRQIEVSYEYLSGNVRDKLQQAIDNNKDGKYNDNIKALEKVVPIAIPSHLIDFSIGSSWIDPKLYADYVKEKTDVSVTFTSAGGTWYMKTPRIVSEQKNRAMGVTSEMLHTTIMGTQLIEAAMQNRTITVSQTKKHYDGTTETITDKEATQACGNKIDEIRQDFKDWARERIQADAEMAKRIERTYNDMFNNYVPKSIPQDFIPTHFGGQVTEMGGKPFSLRPHQAQAVIRATTQPLMLAHEVGTGKTFTLISIAMEMRRLGTARKPMIVVQNATLGQFVESAKELYPNAKVLSLSESDRTKEGRKDFYAKIKYNDWDIIVVPQSVFEMIPDSEERQMQFVQDKIDEKMMILEQMRDADPTNNSMIVRQAEKEIESLKLELASLTQNITEKRSKRDEKKEAVARQNAEVKALEMLDRRVDDVENFDDMGIDAILVDEAHEYKHLGFATAMKRGVKGVDPSYSKKSQGVFLKAQAVLEKNHGRNVVFATGTPISNTAAEIWTFMRYLMPADTMKDYGIYYFDDFVRNFGSITQMLEFTASGSFKEVNRFAGYMNLPELVRIWSGVTDTVLTREAGGVKDKIPEIETGKAQDIYLPQTRALRSVMKYVKSELKAFEEMDGKEKKENSHIPLVMFGIAKAAAVDARLVVEDAADEPNSKTNESVRQVLRSLDDSKEYNGTVALFADNYQNKRTGFNLYHDIRRKLIDAGVPAEQIVVIESGMTVKKKLEIFDKVNSGEIRVIMGSTYTLGTGVNIQERLHTLIHIDAPNRPMDYTQRNGRILRQGNLHKDMNKPVRVLRFGVEDSLDVTAYQRLKTKGAIADSIMNGKAMMANSMENRTLEEEEDVFGDTVAQLSGSEYAMLKNQAEKNVRKYTSKKKQWESDQRYCHSEIPMLRSQIRMSKMALENAQENLAKVQSMPTEKTITIGKQSFRGMEEMTDFLKEYNKKIKEAENELRDNPSIETQERKLTVNVGGIDFEFTTNMEVETIREQATLFSAVHRKMTYSCKEFGLENVQVKGALLRTGLEDILENVVTGADFKYDEERYKANIEKAERSLAQVEERYGKPFEYEKELNQSLERLVEYTELMKKELEEKEAKYAEMDDEVEEAKNVTESSEAQEEEDTEDNNVRFRDGENESREAKPRGTVAEEVETVEEGESTLYRQVEDEDTEEWLEEQPTIKVYRSMALIDGKLYPPMSSKAVGSKELRNPSELGKWEEAEEAPDKAKKKDDGWYFTLNKDNGKQVRDVAYNPYIHTSRTMLNDQFSEAQSRDNLVVVEMEVPISELYSGYKAEKAKDSVGVKQWKAGIIQGMLSGTREVILTRWAKPVRIVPVEEVADNIVDMLDGKVGVMPSNVVTPQQRKALEDRGIQFIETDNKGKIKDGVNAGKTWASVYGSKANGKKSKKSSTKEREGDKRGMTYEQSLAASKSAGYSKAQHDSFVEREKRRIRQHAENIVAKLGLDGRVTIMETPEGLTGRKAKAKGWFDTKTGKIVVVLGNHHSTSDVVRTVLHEGVAHYGLRALFGENFNQFLDNVFKHAEPLVRQKIVDLSKKHNWDFRTATEEYLAQLAEDTEFEDAHNKGWFSRIKSMFLSMLRKIGLADYAGPSLTDNELRYLLWRSYENLAEPGRYRNPFREAKDISKQMDLKVGNYDRERARIHSLGKIDSSRRIVENTITSEDRGALFRDGDFSERDRAIARDAYERAVSSGMYQFKEAVQDSMLGLKELYKAITGNKKLRIEEVEGYENAYLFENRLSSSNQAQQREYYNEFMRPLLKAIGEIAGTSNGARQALTDYMMAKHGLERNDVMPRREAEREAREEFAEELKAAEKAVLADPLDMEAVDALEGVKIRIHDREEELYFEKRSRDYSGLTALTGESKLSDAEAEARRIVADYEAAYDTQDLWNLTREATQATLEKVYKSGLLSRDRYEDIRDMFEYYIPLQGWDETTSDEVYGYLTSKNGLLTGSPIKKAKGRSSKADDPIATIAMMADAAIMQGNRNLMKQSFLNFVLNNPSDLVSVNELWLQYDDTTDEWVPVFADLSKDDTPADVERKVEAFEERMEQLREKEPDKYKRGREAQSIPYKVVKNNLREHQVLVKRNGRTYVLTINGNPRAAQALNGLTNPDVENTGIVGNMLKAGEYINRHLSAFYTTRNPDFVVSNFLRDLLYSNCMSWVKESPAYAFTFHKNFLKYNPIRLGYMLKKWDDGTLDMNNSSEKSFYQFMINGGETGYTSIRDIEQHKKEIIKELKREGSTMRKVWNVIALQLDRINRSVENCARFAAFVTSQEFGRSIERSVYDAKEVSVNFNKKGSGGKMVNAKGQKLIGKVGSYVSGSGRLAFVFWNAGVQGLTNFGRNAKQHKGKAFLGASAMFTLGCIIPLLAGGDGDGDDENAYYNLPEYIRRTNICIRLGKQWITIPLPIEYRSLYGLGELATGVLRDKERYSDEEMAMQLASQISQILPLDMLEGGGGVSPFIPSLAKPYVEAYIMNRGWTGLPVYKQTPWNENDPEWSKAYKNTDKNLVAASKWLNEATGGDDFKKGAIDINPAKLEYLLGGMFGGYITTSEKMVKMAETASGSRDFDWRNILLFNRVVKTGDERTANRKLKTEYFNYKDKADETHRLVKKYKNAAKEGAMGMAEKADFMYNSDEYLRYRIFDAYSKGIERYNEAMKSETNDAARKQLESEMYDLMRELINELHETENKK